MCSAVVWVVQCSCVCSAVQWYVQCSAVGSDQRGSAVRCNAMRDAKRWILLDLLAKMSLVPAVPAEVLGMSREARKQFLEHASVTKARDPTEGIPRAQFKNTRILLCPFSLHE